MKAILIDTTRCIGCRGCQVACKQWNGLPGETTEFFSGAGYQNPRDLSPKTWTLITYNEAATGDHYDWTCGKLQCMHCQEPACAASCPTSAMEKLPEGPVVYHPTRCLGCRYCMLACPFQIIRFDWDKASPYVSKCTMCADRVLAGQEPACVAACPTDAIIFGERDAIRAEAHRRIADNPTGYVNHVYGEKEVGGTCVMHLSSIEFEHLGYRSDLPERSLAQWTRPAMRPIPYVVAGLSVTLGMIAWIVNRRQGVIDSQKSDPKGGTS